MKNKNIWIMAFGVILGVALSANVPEVPEQFMVLQAQATGGGYGDYGSEW